MLHPYCGEPANLEVLGSGSGEAGRWFVQCLVPLRRDAQVFGLLALGSEEADASTRRWHALCHRLGELLSVGVQRQPLTLPKTGAVAAAGSRTLPASASERRASAHTLEAYRRDLGRLFPAQGRTAECLRSHDIRQFAARLHSEGLGADRPALSSWRGFSAGWCDCTIFPPTGRWHPCPALAKAPAGVLSPDQAGALLDALPEDPLEIRDCAMFELFLFEWAAAPEFAGLNLAPGVDLAAGEVTVWQARQDPHRAGGRQGTSCTAGLARFAGRACRRDEPALFRASAAGACSPA